MLASGGGECGGNGFRFDDRLFRSCLFLTKLGVIIFSVQGIAAQVFRLHVGEVVAGPGR